MKQTIFTFLLLSVICLVSCRKDKNELNIKQYDEQQIQNYIKANGLTGFQKDTIGGDTSGIYYKIILPGSGAALDYPDKIRMVYTLRTFDGTYTSVDSINNHYLDYLGHIYSNKLPLGLQTAVYNHLKYPGASIRVLIPSHLAYGVNGTGSGSSQVANNRIRGNECLDYYAHVIGNSPYNAVTKTQSDIAIYDDLVINNYMKANSLSGYTKAESTTIPGNFYYYKILTPGTGSDPVNINSAITATYTGQLFNAYIFDGTHNGDNPLTNQEVDVFVAGVQDALVNNNVAVGTDISMLIPSTLGYGDVAQTTVGIPAFSCLRFTWIIQAVTP